MKLTGSNFTRELEKFLVVQMGHKATQLWTGLGDLHFQWKEEEAKKKRKRKEKASVQGYNLK